MQQLPTQPGQQFRVPLHATVLGKQLLPTPGRLERRHNSTSDADVADMVKACGFESMDELIDATVPAAIRRKERMDIGRFSDGLTEQEFLSTFKWVTKPLCLGLRLSQLLGLQMPAVACSGVQHSGHAANVWTGRSPSPILLRAQSKLSCAVLARGFPGWKAVSYSA